MIIVINTKNYKNGKELVNLVNKIKKYIPKSIISVPVSEINLIKKSTGMEIYAQHVDYTKPGRGTGFITAESIKSNGASGTILNHSEHKLPFKILKETIERCKKNKLKTIVCVTNIRETKLIKKLGPYAIAYEVPSIISTKKPITNLYSKNIKNFSNLLKKSKIIPICGAGISKIEDIMEAKKLGCKGILISSAIANSDNPERFLKEIKHFIRISN